MEIDVEQSPENPDQYAVVIRHDDTIRSQHLVTLTSAELARYGHNSEPVPLLKGAFAFLLDREPPESILERFTVSDIEKYFPEFSSKITDYL